MEATRFPADYDGIVAGAPAWHWANQMINATWNSRAALKDPSALTAGKRGPAQPAGDRKPAIRWMASKDGVIDDPRQCHFDPASLTMQGGRCARRMPDASAGGGGERDLFRRPPIRRHADFPGLCARQRSAMGRVSGPATAPGGSSFDFFRYSVFQDTNFKNTEFRL